MIAMTNIVLAVIVSGTVAVALGTIVAALVGWMRRQSR